MARRLLAVAVVCLVVLAGCQGGMSGDATTDPTTTAPTTEQMTDVAGTTTQPGSNASFSYDDPDADTLGWEGGYWYNESISVDRSDGLNDSELHTVVNRSMARVEVVRGLEFNQSVPVDVISREEFANDTAASYENVTRNGTLHQNVKWEAMFMVGEDENAIDVLASNRAGSVLGYYSPSEDRIAIVSEDTESPQMDEITLSQELFHGLQTHRFNTSELNQSTQELHNAKDGIIEGDGNYVDHRYQQRCERDWDCLRPTDSESPSGSDRHTGIALTRLQPYSDGPVFVEQLYESGGWDAVNDVYENPPASTEQTIHPDRYGVDEPTPVSVADTSTDAWTVPETGNDSVDFASFGEAGLFTMLWYPSYVETQATGQPADVVIPTAHLLAPARNNDTLDLYNYSHPYTDGWDGDKLVPYAASDSLNTSETAYVWASTWDSASDATEFADAYRELLQYHGAERVSDAGPNVWRIPDDSDSGYADAFRVTTTEGRVTIVNAPTVDQLDAVHDSS
ncbi:Hvo_1808 family surface protein [Halobacterium sp. BOL4-2]|uniref:Hvo_1808 family surface protein n=1 Tax=Halobacterium sp. BOL4-2 TaxID=2810537 RepID=UPI0019625E9E|nr:Hvo_1808 family surface protein [Halobacterium sp. BOL4-2]QRY24722.1 Hvo_1808 family surface protein [Halobacterium sp. BOL4-2]